MPDGFISHFYSVSEHVSPVLAFGFLGPKPQLAEVCAFFKVSRECVTAAAACALPRPLGLEPGEVPGVEQRKVWAAPRERAGWSSWRELVLPFPPGAWPSGSEEALGGPEPEDGRHVVGVPVVTGRAAGGWSGGHQWGAGARPRPHASAVPQHQIVQYLRDMFDLDNVRYTSVPALADDVLQLSRRRSEILLGYLGMPVASSIGLNGVLPQDNGPPEELQ